MDEPPPPIQQLADEISSLHSTLASQSAVHLINPFDGDPKKFKTWIKEVEKFCLLGGCDDDRRKRVAFQTCKGTVSDFVQRYLISNAGSTFDQLKHELRLRFGDVIDPQHALRLLREIKQRPTENVVSFAERLLSLAHEATDGVPGGTTTIERVMIGQFVDGLAFDHLKLKVMRTNPASFQDAVKVALSEQNLRKRFSSSIGREYGQQQSNLNTDREASEPMDIDHARPTRRCAKCGRKNHSTRECRTSVREVTPRRITVNPDQYRQERSSRQNQCWECGSTAHFRRDCPKARLN